jgi:hypothetical protein
MTFAFLAGLTVRAGPPCEPPDHDVEVRFGETGVSIHAVDQGIVTVVRRDPRSVLGSDLIIDPDEGASVRPVDEVPGLPVQPIGQLILDGIGPRHHFERRQTESRRDLLVRVPHPRGRPHQFTPQRQQARTVPWIEPREQGIAGRLHEQLGPGRLTRRLGRRAERDERPVDIEEQQRMVRGSSHPRDGSRRAAVSRPP